VSVRRKERHLTFRITAVGAVCVCLDEFSNGEAVGCFFGGDGDVCGHGSSLGRSQSFTSLRSLDNPFDSIQPLRRQLNGPNMPTPDKRMAP
jgi:hypothetical protein